MPLTLSFPPPPSTLTAATTELRGRVSPRTLTTGMIPELRYDTFGVPLAVLTVFSDMRSALLRASIVCSTDDRRVLCTPATPTGPTGPTT
jgi:hypothetical protein